MCHTLFKYTSGLGVWGHLQNNSDLIVTCQLGTQPSFVIVLDFYYYIIVMNMKTYIYVSRPILTSNIIDIYRLTVQDKDFTLQMKVEGKACILKEYSSLSRLIVK